MKKKIGRVWTEYFEAFPYFSPDAVRPGCEPLALDSGRVQNHAIVLVHGLTDSPYFMRAIARTFHEKLGWNVYLPLLQGHGLKNPRGMRGVSLDEWKRNVAFAVESARKRGRRVSIGGFSTGGALAVFTAARQPSPISGGLFLFSAALDLGGRFGNFKEKILRTPLADIVDFCQDQFGQDLIGGNPYRYAHMDLEGAQELSRLIKEIDRLTGARGKKAIVQQPLFCAHSEADTVVDIEGVEELVAKSEGGRAMLFRIGAGFRVKHASVVLDEPIFARNGSPLEDKNPFFNEMTRAIVNFVKANL